MQSCSTSCLSALMRSMGVSLLRPGGQSSSLSRSWARASSSMDSIRAASWSRASSHFVMLKVFGPRGDQQD